jgi:cyclophilin family peptidyl-prolyl cis-trans isomerase
VVALSITLVLLGAPAAIVAQESVSGKPASAPPRSLLANPTAPLWRTPAPDTAVLDVATSKGVITIELIRAWAPHGVDRVFNLARAGFFDDSRFYRVVATYIAQFGLAGDPRVAQRWRLARLAPDSARTVNARGTVSFAQTSPRDRTTDLFINLRDNPNLDSLRFAPIGRVIAGMDVAEALHFGYGDLPSSPPPLGNPRRFYGEANRYLDREYPKLDRIDSVRVRARPTP